MVDRFDTPEYKAHVRKVVDAAPPLPQAAIDLLVALNMPSRARVELKASA